MAKLVEYSSNTNASSGGRWTRSHCGVDGVNFSLRTSESNLPERATHKAQQRLVGNTDVTICASGCPYPEAQCPPVSDTARDSDLAQIELLLECWLEQDTRQKNSAQVRQAYCWKAYDNACYLKAYSMRIEMIGVNQLAVVQLE